MPTSADPRFSVRFTREEAEAVERAARAAGVATGALIRECAVRWCAYLAAERRADAVGGREVRRLRGRSA